MNENAKKWVEALRSGEFQQVAGCLRDAGSGAMCCLGVACEVYRRDTGGGEWGGAEFDGASRFSVGDDGNVSYLPDTVRKWLGLADPAGAYVVNVASMNALSSQNDEGASFTEIADIIESEPAGLFRGE